MLDHNLRVKIYEANTNAYVGTFLYTVRWEVNDGVLVRYYSSKGKFEDSNLSFKLENPTVTYSGDYGYVKQILVVYGYNRASFIMRGRFTSYCDIYGEASGYLEAMPYL